MNPDTTVLRVRKLTPHGFIPVFGSPGAAGLDLISAYNYTVLAHDKELVKTDISIRLPRGTYGRIAPRSGLAWKHFIDVGAGVIDPDYTGNICVVVYNHSNTNFKINVGDRIAQLICERYTMPRTISVSSANIATSDEFESTDEFPCCTLHDDTCHSSLVTNDLDQVLTVCKLTPNGFVPVFGSPGAAGLDLKSAYSYTIPAHGKELVKTDISVKFPSGTYGRIAPNTGLAWRYFIDVGAGVIDPGYTGNICVVLHNHSDTSFEINIGDRIAQLICEQYTTPRIVSIDSLDTTERGDDGFGSSGMN